MQLVGAARCKLGVAHVYLYVALLCFEERKLMFHHTLPAASTLCRQAVGSARWPDAGSFLPDKCSLVPVAMKNKSPVTLA